MDPVITPTEMQAIDREAPEPVEELIDRAGWAVARAAVSMLGRRYGARVLVVAGKGNNGADGRAAARHLEHQGVRCHIVDAADPRSWPSPPTPSDGAGGAGATGVAGAAGAWPYDLVIDAAYGTGFRGTWEPPTVGDVPVLAVDIPSGVDGLTGLAAGQPLAAARTVTFAAVKPGLLFHPGRALAGEVEVADIGLDCSRARAWHVGPDDLTELWPRSSPVAHKWQQAVWVIGGSPAMPGAPCLAASGAGRAGASYTALSVPGLETATPPVPVETVLRPVGVADWSQPVIDGLDRFAALVIGPGLATDELTGAQVRAVVAATGDRPVVLDGGAIDALAADPSVLRSRAVPAVLTPHEGELARLAGASSPGRPAGGTAGEGRAGQGRAGGSRSGAERKGGDRESLRTLDAVRALAADLGAVIVAKGPTTMAVAPDGEVLISTAGDQRLATAGTGDVLAGVIGAGLAGGLDPLRAGGLGAELHGRAALGGLPVGLVAGDLPLLVASELTTLFRTSPTPPTEPWTEADSGLLSRGMRLLGRWLSGRRADR